MLGLGLGVNKNFSGGAATVLEEYGTPAAAYSMRYLYPTIYSGPVIRVRRGSDDAEADFTPDEITNGTLTTWTGANNGLVTTWYDQSGNGYNATQATKSAQPELVSGGSLITSNGKPALDQPSARWFNITVTGFNALTNLSTFVVSEPQSASAPDASTASIFRYKDGGNGGDLGFAYTLGTGLTSGETFMFYFSNGGVTTGRLGSSTYSNSAQEQLQLSLFQLSSGFSCYKNSSAITINLSAGGLSTASNTSPSAVGDPSDSLIILKGYGNQYSRNKYQELIFYGSDQTSNRVSIEANINDYYSIY